MNIDTRTVKQFLSNEEIQTIENHIMSNVTPWENWNPSNGPEGRVMSGLYYVIDYYDDKNKIVRDILAPKFVREFGPDLYIQQIHIFDSFDPYRIHSDVDSGGETISQAPNPAWTLIIPCFDVDSHTIVFNEQDPVKDPEDYYKKTKPFSKSSIDNETYQKYFSHVPRYSFNWLSIENIFQWEKGSLFAADRHKFHTSDNFLANGVKNKRAIIAWTSLPN